MWTPDTGFDVWGGLGQSAWFTHSVVVLRTGTVKVTRGSCQQRTPRGTCGTQSVRATSRPAARSSPQVWSTRYPSLPLKERVRTQRLQERPAPDRSRAEDAWGFLATALGGGSLLLAAPGPPFCASPPCSLLSSETTACHPPGQLLIVFQRNISSSLTRLSRQQHMMEWALSSAAVSTSVAA